jgi:hypothetical protein
MSAQQAKKTGGDSVRVRLLPSFAGARFRPLSWHSLTDDGAELKGYGVQVKVANDRRYRFALVDGDSIPFKTKKEAETWCKAANEKAAHMGAAS